MFYSNRKEFEIIVSFSNKTAAHFIRTVFPIIDFRWKRYPSQKNEFGIFDSKKKQQGNAWLFEIFVPSSRDLKWIARG